MSTIPSPLEMLYHWESKAPDKVFLRQPISGTWHTWTWKEAGTEIRKMAAALKAMRLPLHSNIAIISKNCAHWIMSDLAIMMAGHVSVPLYPNLTAGSVRQILDHCDAPLVFVGKLDAWDNMKAGVPEGVQCISFPFYGPRGYLPWEKLLSEHQPLQGEILRDGGEPGTLIYTSGSTGVPKGVMHKISNFSFASYHAMSYIGVNASERFFSYLPLAHIGERFFVEMGVLYSGGDVSFAESVEKFQENIRDTNPTIFLGVHRIWKKFQEGILAKLSQKKLNVLLSIPIVSNLIRKKVKQGLGFEHTTRLFTSAAPTPPDLIEWFGRLGIRIAEGYAMTETFAYSHGSLMHEARTGWAGHPLPHVQSRLGEDGEVLVKHEALMDGYYKDPEQTREMFTEDGFLRTGDRGEIDADGYLKITGRTKEIFKTSKGKYVAPSPIEMRIGSHSDVEMACVTGSSLPQPIALITLTENGKGKDRNAILAELEKHIRQINRDLDNHERIEKVVLLDENWSIENDMLTPTMKIKRREIEARYSANYDLWYNKERFVVEK
jgi:long-chain acyl-CoA synthetase